MDDKHECVAHKQDMGTSTQKQFATCLAGNQDKSRVSELELVLLSEPRVCPAAGLALQEQPGAGRQGGAEILAFLVGSVLSSPKSSGMSGGQELPTNPTEVPQSAPPMASSKEDTSGGVGRAESLCGSRGAGLSFWEQQQQQLEWPQGAERGDKNSNQRKAHLGKNSSHKASVRSYL